MTILRCSFIRFSSLKHFRPKSTYVILIPEVPKIKSEENPLLNFDTFPNFEELNAEKCYVGISKLSLNHESDIFRLSKNLTESDKNTFNGIINELEKIDHSLQSVWNILKILCIVRHDILQTNNFRRIHERAQKAHSRNADNYGIYKACKEALNETKQSTLNSLQRSTLEKIIRNHHSQGAHLSLDAKKGFIKDAQEIEDLQNKYFHNLELKENSFKDHIYSEEEIKEFPPHLRKRMILNGAQKNKGPWTVSLEPDVYDGVLKYCPSKKLRFRTWHAYTTRASQTGKQNNNFEIFENIRTNRLNLAKQLGFKCYADLVIQNNMAESKESVLSMINKINNKASKMQSEEMKSLQKFSETKGLQGDLNECDVPYWRRRQKLDLFNFDDCEFQKYFPFEHIWNELLSFTSNLFGIQYEEVTIDKQNWWHPDVRRFNVLDKDGTFLSNFFLDPYERPESKLRDYQDSAWMFPYTNRSHNLGYNSAASLIFNFDAPSNKIPSLLTWRDLKVLFSKFGLALQHLLTTVPYNLMSGVQSIELDAREISSHFLSYWLCDASLLSKLSHNYEDGSPLKKEEIKNIIASHSHLMGYDLCNELFISNMDIKLYSTPNLCKELLRELYPKYRPFRLPNNYSMPCWFIPFIDDFSAANYYAGIWSRILAADSFNAFHESPNEKAQIGKRYREIFSQLGGRPASEIFREFRGRDPSHESIFKLGEFFQMADSQ